VVVKLPKATLYIEVLSMVNFVSIVPIATGWSDQLPGGIRTHRKPPSLHGALDNPD